jgi:hypothetical protein
MGDSEWHLLAFRIILMRLYIIMRLYIRINKVINAYYLFILSNLLSKLSKQLD